MMLGTWKLVDACSASLPQKAATAFSAVLEGLVGANYTPIAYVGEQVVNGVNYAIIAKRTLVTKEPIENIVLMEIYVAPNGSTTLAGMKDIL